MRLGVYRSRRLHISEALYNRFRQFILYMAEKPYKLIRISPENWKILNSRGKINETFNTVLTRIFEENGLLGIATTDEGEASK